MSRAGRRPTPTPLRLLRGNPGHRPLPKDEADPPLEPPQMPPWLRVLDGIAAGYNVMPPKELRAQAAAAKIPGRSKMDRQQLIDALMAAHPGPRELGWQELAPMLTSMRLVTAADVHALALTVDAYVDYIELRRIVEDDGQTYRTEGRYGLQVKQRPEVFAASKRWEQTLKGLIEFGLTPASRTKVAAIPKGEEDPLDALRRRGSAG